MGFPTGPSDINLLLVAHGVRPGHIVDKKQTKKANIIAAIKSIGLQKQLSVYQVRVKEKPVSTYWMILSSMLDAPPSEMSHIDVAEMLGIPCASKLAFEDPSLCFSFMVQVQKRDDTCGRDDPWYITSFSCKDIATGKSWLAEFKKKANDFESKMLHPIGLQWGFFMAGPVNV